MNQLTAIRTFAKPGFSPAKRTRIEDSKYYLVLMQNTEPGYGLICHCAPYCPPSTNSEQGQEYAANARLIAAAVDMYEALDAMLGVFAAKGESERRAVSKAFAAIAKAEGRV